MVNKVKKLFEDLEKEAKAKNLSEARIKLLRIIGWEAEAGCKFADKIQEHFPELIDNEVKRNSSHN